MQKDSSVNEWRGWIQKQGSVVPSWKKRFLVLSGQNISYYDKDVSNPRAKEKGSFVLAGVQPNKSHNNCMTLMSNEGKAMNITTKTVGEFVMCKNAMENAVATYRSRLSAPAAAAAGEYRSSSTRSEQSSVGGASPSTYEFRGSNDNLRSPPQQYPQQPQPQRQNPYTLRSQTSSTRDTYQQQYRQQQQQQVMQNRPTYVGWLEKEGEMVKSWKTRYFVLRDLDVAYFDKIDGNQKGGGRVSDVTVTEEGLQFHLDSGRIVNVRASSSADLQGWYDAVCQVMGRPTVDITLHRRQLSEAHAHPQYGGAGMPLRHTPPTSSQDKPLSAFLDKYVSTAAVANKVADTYHASVGMAKEATAVASQKVATAYENRGQFLDAAKQVVSAIPLKTVGEAIMESVDMDTGELHSNDEDDGHADDDGHLDDGCSDSDYNHEGVYRPSEDCRESEDFVHEDDDVQDDYVHAEHDDKDHDDFDHTTDEDGVLESMTPDIVADFASRFSMGDLPSPPPVAPQREKASNGLWLQKGGAAYVADPNAERTVLTTRHPIATDVVPPPRPQQPIVRNTSSDDLKAQLWVISPKATPVVQPPVVTAPTKPLGVALPGMTGDATISRASKDDSTNRRAFSPNQNTTVKAAAAPVALAAAPATDSGLWIQKGGATYVPDESAVPTVLPTRTMIATDIPPPASKGSIVRTSSSDDLKAKLWVAPPTIPVASSLVQAPPAVIAKNASTPDAKADSAVRGMGSSPARPQQSTPAPRGFGSSAVPTIVTPLPPVPEVEVVISTPAVASPRQVVEDVVKPPVAPVFEVKPEVDDGVTRVVSDRVPPSAKSKKPADMKKQSPAPKGCCTIM